MPGPFFVLAALVLPFQTPAEKPRLALLPHEETLLRLTEEADKNYGAAAVELAKLLEQCKAARDKGIALSRRLAILRRAVRLADRAYFREQAITEQLELAHLCRPSIPLHSNFYGGRHEDAFRNRGGYRMLYYLEIFTHRWPGERED
jgi:hypothetical protein